MTSAVVEAVAAWQLPVQCGEAAPLSADQLEREAQEWVRQALALAGEDGQSMRVHVEQGEPSTVLLTYAARAQLLVLGNHEHEAVPAAVGASVAQRCTHRAVCPVVLVPLPPG